MTERLADITRRIANVQQLEAVVTAMRGIAASRAQQSRARLPGVRAYAEVIARAIAAALALLPRDGPAGRPAGQRSGVILFAAEQGFAGAFSDRMLDAAAPLLAPRLPGASLFLLGARGIVLAEERQLPLAWRSGMAPHIDAVPAVAARIADALYERIDATGFDRVTMVFPVWSNETGLGAETRVLLPFDFRRFAGPPAAQPPLATLPVEVLLARLAEEYVFAELCEAAMSAFAAENEARVAAMIAAKGNIERVRSGLEARERQTRQEEITAEVAELAGAMANL
jgi:F-type H+-transporting ATPase subunit gamma